MGEYIKYAYRLFLLIFLVLAIGVASIFYKESKSVEDKNDSEGGIVRVTDLLEDGGQIVEPDSNSTEDDVVIEDNNLDLSNYLAISDVLIQGKIPAINGYYFEDLSGENLTLVDAHELGGVQASGFLRSNENDTMEAVLTLTSAPGSVNVSGGPLYINPQASSPNYTLMGIAVNGSSKFRVDAEGDTFIAGDAQIADDLILGSGTFDNQSGSADAYVTGNLEVDGTIYGNISGTISPGLTEGSVAFIDSGGNFTEDNSNFFWDDANNRLGIGRTDPIESLDLGLNNTMGFSVNSTDTDLVKFYDGSTVKHAFVAHYAGAGSSPNWELGIKSDTVDPIISFERNGGVGIGTYYDTEGSKLFVVGNDSVVGDLSYISSFTNSNDAYNTSPKVGITFRNVYSPGGSWARMGGIQVGKENTTSGDAAGYLTLHTSGSTLNSVTEKLRITSSGNIGIGTDSPISKLHVSGAVNGKALAIFDETGDQNIFSASSSGTPVFTIGNSGDLNMI